MTSADVGVEPIASQSGPNYVLAASDANVYQIKAAQLAATRAQRDDVKSYAKRVLAEAQSSQKALMAALKNDQRTIKAPSSALSADRAALLKLLQKAPKSVFDNLYLTQSAQVQTILLVQFLAFFGAVALGRIAARIGAWKTVLGSLVIWAATLGLAYNLPVGKPLPFMGLGVLIGIVLGGSQALSRSLFSQLIPHGREAEYFGLYEISANGTSWLGPLLFGLIYQATGDYQYAIISLLVFFVVGFAGLLAVPMRRAVVAAGNTPPQLI